MSAKGSKFASGFRVELDKDEVPNFDAKRRVLVDELTLSVAFFGKVYMDFTARSTRAGVPHHPKIILFAAFDDVLIGIESFGFEQLCPYSMGLGIKFGRITWVRLVNSGVEALFGETPNLGQEFPGPIDGLFLKVVAKGPVAEHLKEGVVISIKAHVFEIVMLATGSNALLGICCRWEGS